MIRSGFACAMSSAGAPMSGTVSGMSFVSSAIYEMAGSLSAAVAPAR